MRKTHMNPLKFLGDVAMAAASLFGIYSAPIGVSALTRWGLLLLAVAVVALVTFAAHFMG